MVSCIPLFCLAMIHDIETVIPDMYGFIHIIFISDAPTATWVIFQRVLPIAQVQVSSFQVLLNIIFVSNNIHVYIIP